MEVIPSREDNEDLGNQFSWMKKPSLLMSKLQGKAQVVEPTLKQISQQIEKKG